MRKEAPEIRLVRETLEGVLHPSTASAVFFDALTAHGGALPTDTEATLALVRGPLRGALAERLGESEAQSVIGGLEQMFVAIRDARSRSSRHDEITQSVALSDAATVVFVLASASTLAERLEAVVGPKVLTTVVIGDEAIWAERLAQLPPGFVLVDASDFPAIEPSALAGHLRALPPHLVRALWGVDLPYGQSLLAEALPEAQLTPFDRREGIEPLLDVIRSRTAR